MQGLLVPQSTQAALVVGRPFFMATAAVLDYVGVSGWVPFCSSSSQP